MPSRALRARRDDGRRLENKHVEARTTLSTEDEENPRLRRGDAMPENLARQALARARAAVIATDESLMNVPLSAQASDTRAVFTHVPLRWKGRHVFTVGGR